MSRRLLEDAADLLGQKPVGERPVRVRLPLPVALCETPSLPNAKFAFMPWELVFKRGKLKTSGDVVFVIAKNEDKGQLDLIRAPRIMRGGNEPPPHVPHEQVPIDDIDLDD